jgi:hypothetical protein
LAFVFLENFRHQNVILKLTDLYGNAQLEGRTMIHYEIKLDVTGRKKK